MWSWTSVGRLGKTPLFLCRLPRPETHRDRTGYQGHTGWGGEQVTKAIRLGCMTACIFLHKALSSLCLAQSLSLWHQCAKSLSWQLIQARVRPNTVSSNPLPTSVSSHITSFPPFICDHIMWLSIISWKTTQKIQTRFLCSRDDSAEPVPSTSSKLVNNRPPTQEGTQTSQESASTSERPRFNQVLCETWWLLWSVPSSRTQNVMMLSTRLAHNSEVCVIGSISTTQVQDCS